MTTYSRRAWTTEPRTSTPPWNEAPRVASSDVDVPDPERLLGRPATGTRAAVKALVG